LASGHRRSDGNATARRRQANQIGNSRTEWRGRFADLERVNVALPIESFGDPPAAGLPDTAQAAHRS